MYVHLLIETLSFHSYCYEPSFLFCIKDKIYIDTVICKTLKSIWGIQPVQPNTLYVIMYFMFATYFYFTWATMAMNPLNLKRQHIHQQYFTWFIYNFPYLTNSIQYKLTFNMFFTVLWFLCSTLCIDILTFIIFNKHLLSRMLNFIIPPIDLFQAGQMAVRDV